MSTLLRKLHKYCISVEMRLSFKYTISIQNITEPPVLPFVDVNEHKNIFVRNFNNTRSAFS